VTVRMFGSRWAIGLAAITLVAGACSSAQDNADGGLITTTESNEPAPAADEPAEESATAGTDCEFLGAQRVALQSYAAQMTVLDNEETFDLAVGDEGLDAMETAIEAFRPYENIDTIFGPIKEGLDNLATDIASVRAGEFQYGEPSGTYSLVGINGLLEELDC